jgi:hypothetical protein
MSAVGVPRIALQVLPAIAIGVLDVERFTTQRILLNGSKAACTILLAKAM